MKVKVKRRALRRTAGPGTAAAGPGDRRGDLLRAGKRSRRVGMRAPSPWGRSRERTGEPGRREPARFCGRTMREQPAARPSASPAAAAPRLPLPVPVPEEGLGTEGCGGAARRGRMLSHPPARASRETPPAAEPRAGREAVPLGSRLQGTGERRSPGPAGLAGTLPPPLPLGCLLPGACGAAVSLGDRQEPPPAGAVLRAAPHRAGPCGARAEPRAGRLGAASCPAGGRAGWAQGGGERRGSDLPSPFS